jgi:hypothetical protein
MAEENTSRAPNMAVWMLGVLLAGGAAVLGLPRLSESPPAAKPTTSPTTEEPDTGAQAETDDAEAPDMPLELITMYLRRQPQPKGKRASSKFELRDNATNAKLSITVDQEAAARTKQLSLAKQLESVQPVQLEFLIATVPDPLETRFPHEFDAVLRGMQQAFEAREFTLKASWLPWRRNREGQKSASRGSHFTPREYPGVLLFARQKQRATDATQFAVVCVVGETPLAGIHKPAFARALLARSKLDDIVCSARSAKIPISWACNAERLLVVAPFFTGSQESLALALAGQENYKVISGSASGLAPHLFPHGALHATVIPNDLLQHGIMNYLAGNRGAELSDKDVADVHAPVAFLRETNTEFGQSSLRAAQVCAPGSKRTTGGALDLPFPMSISRLEADQARTDQPVLPATGFTEPRFPVRDRPDFDTIPPYDAAAAASTAGECLRAILTTINDARVSYVGVVATDTRDVIYLNRWLRKECPRVRVFTTEPSVALLQPDDAYQLRGMLVASTYPLTQLAESRAQGRPGGRQLIPFPTQASQGYYNAILAQFRAPELLIGYRVPPVQDPNIRTRDRPPIWISVVGANGSLVPVHCYTEYKVSDDTTVRVAPIHADQLFDDPACTCNDQVLIPSVPGSVLLGSLASVLVLGLVVLSLLWPTLWHEVAAGLTVAEEGEPDHLRDTAWVWAWRCVMMAGVLVFALPYAIPAHELWSASCGFVGHHTSHAEWLAIVVMLGLLGIIVACAVRAFAVPDAPGRGFCVLMAALAGIALIVALLWPASLSSQERFFLYVRATDLTSGVSPLLPMGLIGAAVVAVGWGNLCQADLARRRRLQSPFTGPAWHAIRTADQELFAAQSFTYRPVVVLVALTILFFGLLTWYGGVSLPSEEGTGWDYLIRGLFWFTVAMILFSLFRFVSLWARLHKLLEELCSVPLAGAFSHLPNSVRRLFRGYLQFNRIRRPHLAALAWTLPQPQRTQLADLIAQERSGLGWIFGRCAATGPTSPTTARDRLAPDERGDRHWLAERLQNHAANFLAVLPDYWAGRPSSEDAEGGGKPAKDESRASVPRATHGEPTDQAFVVSATVASTETVSHVLAEGAGIAVTGATLETSEAEEAVVTVRREMVVTTVDEADIRQMEVYLAAFMTIYLGGYFSQLRMLVRAMAVATPLLLFGAASYSFQPDRPGLKLLLVVAGVVTAGIVYVLYRVNCDGLVSRIKQTTPHAFTPDAGFLSSIATYVLPILAVVLLQVLGLFRVVIEPILGLFQ